MIDYFTDNSLRRTTYNVSLVNLLTVLIFQPRVLADGGGVYLSDNFAGFVGYNLMCYTSIPVFCFNIAADYPFPIVEALASEFNLSHLLFCFNSLTRRRIYALIQRL